MQLDMFIQDAVTDRMEGWELADFLQVPIRDLLGAALENDWLNDDNLGELLELLGLEVETKDEDDNDYA